jgi:tRNA(Ile)-lysidine synthase
MTTIGFLEQDVATILACKGRVVVGFSGGLDSHVLLHLLQNLLGNSHQNRHQDPHQNALQNRQENSIEGARGKEAVQEQGSDSEDHNIKLSTAPTLCALHIDHDLQSESAQWASHCADVCRTLDIPFHCEIVKVSTQGNLEANARQARYTVFEQSLGKQDLLLLGHHLDDQVETAYLQFLRGTKPFGLQGMPKTRPVGLSALLRPMLHLARRDILEYAQTHKLAWIEDPSNAEHHFDRNYLRGELIPLMEKRWPDMKPNIQRYIAKTQSANQLIAEIAEQDFDAIAFSPLSVSLPGLRALSMPRLENVLRFWFGQHQSKSPSDKFINAIVKGLVQPTDSPQMEADPIFRWQGLCLSRNQQAVVLLPEVDEPTYFQGQLLPNTDLRTSELTGPVSTVASLATDGIAHGAGVLRVERVIGAGLSLQEGQCLEIRRRQGGEKLKFERHRSLKNIFQESGVPAVLRDTVPLLYVDDELVGIAAISPIGPMMCIVPARRAGSNEQGWVVEWNL